MPVPVAVMSRSGRKRAITDKIVKLAPEGFDLYVEPFVGSGDVFYAMDLPPTMKAVINDLDTGVYKTHKLLKQIKSVPDPNAYEMSDTELNAFVNKKHSSPLAQLVRLLARFAGGFNGRVPPDNEDMKLYRWPSMAKKLKRVETINQYMKNTTVLNQDYKSVIKKYDGPRTFFYLDPPYESTAGEIYAEDDINYDDLAATLKSIKGKFLMSINDNSKMRKLFNDFDLTAVKVKTRNNQTGISSAMRRELFVQNY